jgi:hypothetical protein
MKQPGNDYGITLYDTPSLPLLVFLIHPQANQRTSIRRRVHSHDYFEKLSGKRRKAKVYFLN